MINMKTLIVFLMLALGGCAESMYDPTHPSECARAKAIRKGHTQSFAGPR